MKYKIKILVYIVFLGLSNQVVAADGDFTGNIKFTEKGSNSIQLTHFILPNVPKNYNSGVKIVEHIKQLTFMEKIESARDK
ncbi:hypothetical protein PVK62_01105 [Aliivibrio sp. S3MY1]|uniref:hypothetical protein n=1 Tax=unclassified Aliivibrio TaxID=2645654 RepID=UPI002379F38C|nr:MULTISPECIES: hypothetical protein [unclassified Aliivibrio]MDD9194429.1 hypothetical protein [Aliivibrio sp. S3MY1]MDD9198232.1 hypothetical protein [Aliivibrio sp. S2MY1]